MFSPNTKKCEECGCDNIPFGKWCNGCGLEVDWNNTSSKGADYHVVKPKVSEKKALEFVTDYMKREAKEHFEEMGFYKCFKEWVHEHHFYDDDGDDSRHWTNTFCAVNIDGILIGYDWADSTGDEHPENLGWEFSRESICYVEKKEIMTIKYIKKES